MNTFLKTIAEKKRIIDKRCDDFFNKKQSSLQTKNPWEADALTRLHNFMTGGKTVRGSLILTVKEMTTKDISSFDIDTALALELIHSGLLIHDDIMDNDELRRGKPTMYAQYSQLAKDEQIPNADHFGRSMAICVADLAFFLAFQLVATHSKSETIIHKLSEEMSWVAPGQMQDLYYSVINTNITHDGVLNIYTYKTARYTFSLPFALASILAHKPAEEMAGLEKLGEYIGLIYQIRDDELNLTGDPAVTGKPMGSDIREQKKTLHYSYLLERLSETEKTALPKKEVEEVLSLLEEKNVNADVAQVMNTYQTKAEELLRTLPISEEHKHFFSELLIFSRTRIK